MSCVPASIGGRATVLAFGLVVGLVALGGGAIAQEAAEPTPSGRRLDADGDAVRAVPDANGRASANGDGEDVVYGDIGPGPMLREPIVVGIVDEASGEAVALEPAPVAPTEAALEPGLAVEAPENVGEFRAEETAAGSSAVEPPAEGPAGAATQAAPAPVDSFTISNEEGDAAAYGIPGRAEDSTANARPGRIEGVPSFQEAGAVDAPEEVEAAGSAPATDGAPAPVGTPGAEAAEAPADGVAATPSAVAPVASCDDFGTWYDAQVEYEAAGGVAADPELVASLDADADGVACEETARG